MLRIRYKVLLLWQFILEQMDFWQKGIEVNVDCAYSFNIVMIRLGAGKMENKYDMPMGFVFQLSMDANAMDNFARMTEEEKQKVIDSARGVTSKEEMRGIVENLAKMIL